jgi:hypothetical protein
MISTKVSNPILRIENIGGDPGTHQLPGSAGEDPAGSPIDIQDGEILSIDNQDAHSDKLNNLLIGAIHPRFSCWPMRSF